jgi:hypothetical protein
MSPERSYQAVGPPVVHETIDGEALIINLETGSYYTLDGAAAIAWEALEAGTSPSSLAELLADRLPVPADELARGIESLLAELITEGLVRATGGEAPADDGERGEPLEGLRLHRYDELQELLLIDPIHEVADAGWPRRSPAA